MGCKNNRRVLRSQFHEICIKSFLSRLLQIFFLAWGCIWLTPEVQGQTTPLVTDLLVEIWPEYDRPEVLVIYRGELSQTTSFPAEVTFPLPNYVETMHVVASEREGRLFELDASAVELRRDDQQTILTFSVTSPKFQFEYYDSQILTQADRSRSLNFEFSTLHPVEAITFEIQEPLGAEDFQMTPLPENNFTGTNGLQYHTLSKTGLAEGDTFSASATYQRSTDELTATGLTADISPPLEVTPVAATDNNLWFAYLLIGLGITLLLVAVGSWWWNRQKQSPRRKASSGLRRRQSTASPKGAKFCHQCGTPFRGSAKFCHNCGAERRYA